MVLELNKDYRISASRAEELVNSVLFKAWPNDPSRQKVLKRGGKLNLTCPYCGDSQDAHKKRGNFYLKTLTYKCYNGGCKYSQPKVFRDLLEMVKDFDLEDLLTSEEKIGIINVVKEEVKSNSLGSNINIHEELINKKIKEKLVPRSLLMKELKLEEVIKTPMENYLKKRQQIPDKKFAVDPYGNRLFLFNLDPSGEYIFGLQIRNFKYATNKYNTYKLSKIWSEFLKNDDKEFLSSLSTIDDFSTLFGIFTTDLNKTFTIFEGPMDAWLFSNSIGLCSLNNIFPLDLANKRYLLDDDKAGKIKSIELIKSKESVFLWEKFKKENQLSDNLLLSKGKKRIKDLTDLIIYCRRNGVKIKRLDDYFSSDPLDMLGI